MTKQYSLLFEDAGIIQTIQYVWNHFYTNYTKDMKETDERIQAARSQPSTNFQGLTQEGDNVSLLEMTLVLLLYIMKNHFV